MSKVIMRRQQAALVPPGITTAAKEFGAHVVIDPMNLPAKLAEVVDYFGANQARRPCNEGFRHSHFSI
jgi:hypothetical protein